jgi:uncharacterized protein (TIGR03086 family)
MDAMDAMEALDASAERNVALVAQVGPEQWDDPTPCTAWNVRTLVGHLIAGRHAYCGILRGCPATKLRSIMARQSEAADDDPVGASEDAVRAVRAAFAERGALERTVRHPTMGEMPGSRLLVQLVSDAVIHSWDLATAIGTDPGLDDRLVEFAYAFYTGPPFGDGALYTLGYFVAPTEPPAPDASPLDRLVHLVGRYPSA